MFPVLRKKILLYYKIEQLPPSQNKGSFTTLCNAAPLSLIGGVWTEYHARDLLQSIVVAGQKQALASRRQSCSDQKAQCISFASTIATTKVDIEKL